MVIFRRERPTWVYFVYLVLQILTHVDSDVLTDVDTDVNEFTDVLTDVDTDVNTDVNTDANEYILVVEEPFAGSELDCPSTNDRTHTWENVPWGDPWRAYKALPKGLRVAPSRIPNAGHGVFSDIFIKKFTWLGEYEGEYVPVEKEYEISYYTWMSYRAGTLSHFIDGHNIDTSNGLRFINCARNRRELNVDILMCKGKVYYMVTSDIAPGQELLVYYGDEYAEMLGIEPFP